MKLLRGVCNIPSEFGPCVATIGDFDGLHVGHQQILQQVREQAKTLQLPSLLITFEPTAKEYFAASSAPARLTRLREKLALLQYYAIDYVLVMRFNRTLSQLSAQEFISDLLVQRCHIKQLIIGDDFRFGYQRQGDFELLKRFGERYHYQVTNTHTFQQEKRRVSSTLVRESLAQGDFDLVKQLLGRPYSMYGRVAHGQQRGRMINFPTANIHLHRQVSPILGVFAVKVYGLHEDESEACYGVANVGNRPTVDGTRTLLEIHLFDFDREIYGHYIRTEFVYKLRDEKKYDSFELLRQQIFKDAEQARAYFDSQQ